MHGTIYCPQTPSPIRITPGVSTSLANSYLPPEQDRVEKIIGNEAFPRDVRTSGSIGKSERLLLASVYLGYSYPWK